MTKTVKINASTRDGIAWEAGFHDSYALTSIQYPERSGNYRLATCDPDGYLDHDQIPAKVRQAGLNELNLDLGQAVKHTHNGTTYWVWPNVDTRKLSVLSLTAARAEKVLVEAGYYNLDGIEDIPYPKDNSPAKMAALMTEFGHGDLEMIASTAEEMYGITLEEPVPHIYAGFEYWVWPNVDARRGW